MSAGATDSFRVCLGLSGLLPEIVLQCLVEPTGNFSRQQGRLVGRSCAGAAMDLAEDQTMTSSQVFVESKSIRYSDGTKYQLRSDCWLDTGILGYDVKTKFIRLFPNGFMRLKDGYAWDGASGPTIDTKPSMRSSAGHDALYKLCRLGLLPADLHKVFDSLLERWSLEDGMWTLRAKLWERVLNRFGRNNLWPSKERPVKVAP